jgi:hypothetical protein
MGGGIGNSFINKNITDLNGADFKIDENSFEEKLTSDLSLHLPKRVRFLAKLKIK